MKYVVAVSGGIDSMVLLDMLAREGAHQLVVAHFDHGIRSDSQDDAVFVREAAARYGVPFETMREELGEGASEALARARRYAFLRDVANRHHAKIVTAHHLDDLVETVAINAIRGTGWRGLSVFEADIIRPLLEMEKSELEAYAQHHGITWREDSTNASSTYLRNRIRPVAAVMPQDMKRQIRALHAHQKALRQEIETETRRLIGEGPWYSRYFFGHLPPAVAYEGLREITGGRLTRPQLARLLHAVKVARPGTVFEAGQGIRFHFSTRQFRL